jgi:hypothetical protein
LLYHHHHTAKKAKAFIALLLQKGRGISYRGSVEFVYSGSRVKVYLPSEGCTLQLTLQQVRCPLLGRSASAALATPARTSEPFAEEARRFARRQLMQRLVREIGGGRNDIDTDIDIDIDRMTFKDRLLCMHACSCIGSDEMK